MNSNEDKYRKHMGKSHKLTIDNEVFYMKPLGGRHLSEFLKVVSGMSHVKENAGVDDIAKAFSHDTVEGILELMFVCFKKADPDVPDEVLKEFIDSNFWEIFPAFVEVNGIASGKQNPQMLDKIRQMKEARGLSNDKDSGVPQTS